MSELQQSITPKQIRNHTNYVSHFLSLRSAADLLPVFTVSRHSSLKEISESWAMLQAVFKYIDKDTRKSDVKVFVIGDGVTARTGTLFAYLTKWNITSIDPNFRDKPTADVPVERLETLKCRIEDLPVREYDEKVIIIMPHAHASANIALKRIHSRKQRSLIVCPCCMIKQQLPNTTIEPIIYQDDRMMTVCNIVYIYQNI